MTYTSANAIAPKCCKCVNVSVLLQAWAGPGLTKTPQNLDYMQQMLNVYIYSLHSHSKIS